MALDDIKALLKRSEGNHQETLLEIVGKLAELVHQNSEAIKQTNASITGNCTNISNLNALIEKALVKHAEQTRVIADQAVTKALRTLGLHDDDAPFDIKQIRILHQERRKLNFIAKSTTLTVILRMLILATIGALVLQNAGVL